MGDAPYRPDLTAKDNIRLAFLQPAAPRSEAGLIEPFPASPIAMKIVHHWLSTARRVPSPNCDDRPDPTDISLVVLHCISLPREFGGDGIDRLFTNTLAAEQHPYYAGIAHLRVSAHLLIRRDGEIVQYVPFHRRAWHAGLSSYRGRTNCNDFSIGIELEGAEGSNSMPFNIAG